MDVHRSGIKVGAGDVRSVVRGQVLAAYTQSRSDSDAQALAVRADELAQRYVEQLATDLAAERRKQ
jgi:hypothetical protein